MNYDKIIYHILKKNNLLYMIDDLIDVGYVGASKGDRTFDSTKGTKEITYIYKCAKNEIINHIRKSKAKKRDFVEVIFNDYDAEDETINIEEDLIKQQEYYELYKQVFKLPIYEQYVIYQTFFKNRTQQEILERFNRIHDEKYTQPDISNLKNNGLAILRKNLEK